jgi:outer membrane protein TolC
LLVAGGPVDATEEPIFSSPEAREIEPAAPGAADRQAAPAPILQIPAIDGALLQRRTDVQLFAAGQHAAERVLRDSSKDYFPYLEGVFLPQTTYPAQFFVPANSWRFQLQMSVPLFDSGQRKGVRAEREAALNIARATFLGAITQAAAEIRAAREAVQSAERGLASARAAADQAQQVVNIVNISFRAGAATNIEVIDAERRARDSDTAVAVAEDTLRRARLELLTALGRFPQ